MAGEKRSFLEKVRALCAKVLSFPIIRKSLEILFGGKIPEEVRASRATLRILLFDCVLMAWCVGWGILVKGGPGVGFREGHTMTWVSFFQLLAIAYFLGLLWEKTKPAGLFDKKHPSSVWRFLSWAFYYLAFDEQFKLHETIDHTIHKILRMKETTLTDHIDDFIVIFYGLFILALALYHVRELWRYRSAIGYAIPACLCAFASLILDPIVADEPLLISWFGSEPAMEAAKGWLDALEESFKILAEVFILGTVLCCLDQLRAKRAG